MIVSERTPINGEVYPFHLSQKATACAFCDFLLSQTFDGNNAPHSYNPAIKNQALNALAKSLGHAQFSTMMARAKKHQQQAPSIGAIIDHPHFLTLFPLHYAEAMGPHVTKTPFSNPNFSQLLKEFTTKQLRFRLQKNVDGVFSATIAANKQDWYAGDSLSLPYVAEKSKKIFLSVILDWYHALIKMGYDVDLNRHFVIENFQLLNVLCPQDLIQACVEYQQFWNSPLPLNAEIDAQFALVDQRLNEHIRVEKIPYDTERYGPISLNTHIVRFNKNGLVIPSAYFSTPRPIILMDICTITDIKDQNLIEIGTDDKKKKRLWQLTEFIKNDFRFSLLLSIIEKATDYTHPMNTKELLERTIKDYEQLVGFIPKENIVESPFVLEKLIPVLMDERYTKEERAELSIKSSLELLTFFEGLKITSTPASSQRFKLAEQVAIEGERLGLTPGYPTIMICIASIYECIDARKVLKIEEKGKEKKPFNPSNCLGDIMSFYRVATAIRRINEVLPEVDVLFRTEDQYLENLHQYIKVTEIIRPDNIPVLHSEFIQPEKLFPKLYKNGKCINEQERDKLFALLNFKVD
ncbi:hypothetical protein ACEWIT_003872 [Providencia rettgeri]